MSVVGISVCHLFSFLLLLSPLFTVAAIFFSLIFAEQFLLLFLVSHLFPSSSTCASVSSIIAINPSSAASLIVVFVVIVIRYLPFAD